MGTSISATTQFLQAEEAATRVLESLERLREEAQRYTQATESLADIGSRIVALAVAVEDLSERATEAVEAVRTVGAPAIIDGLAKLNASITPLVDEMERLGATATTLVEKSVEHKGLVQAFQFATMQRFDVVNSEIRSVAEFLNKSDAVARETAARVMASITFAAATQAKRLRIVTAIAVVSAVAAAIAAGAVFVR